MARRRRRTRRNGRGRLSFLYRLLAFLLICGAIVAALALFFKVERIDVEGVSRYSQQEVVSASGVALGDNLILMDKYAVATRITSALSYVESVQISRTLPSTLCIAVKECRTTAAVVQDGTVWLLSAAGKIVDSASSSEGHPVITGVTLLSPQVGQSATVQEEHAARQMLSLLRPLREKEMLGQVQQIHLEDSAAVTIRYLDRFTVLLPWDADMDYKMNYLQAVVERLENNEHGTINMMQDHKVNFIPD